MSQVTTAVVLAGGLGKRLRSIVHDVPKPMAEIQSRPFLAHAIDYWITQGIERFILSVGYLHTTIMDFFGDTYRGAKIDYVVEKTPLGPGGGLLLTLESMALKEPLLLLNGDTYFKVDLANLCAFASSNQADLVFSLFETKETGRYMAMDVALDGRINSLPAATSPTGRHLANGGVWWMNPSTCSKLWQKPSTGDITLDHHLFPSLFSAGARLFGLTFAAPFIDIGLPDDYLRFQKQFEAITEAPG